jgi:CRISPR system Cascade subunit CasC
MPRTIIDVHVIQTVPPSNLNRDDTGSPKTATYGGVRRARVSSQAWKRATRDAFDDLLDGAELGVRSKRVVELVAEQVTTQDAALAPRAQELAAAVLLAAGIKTTPPRKAKEGEDVPAESGYLIFFSRNQVRRLAELAVDAAHTAGDDKPKIDGREARKRADQEHSVDVSLFGRMVAEVTELNVDAAVQVAHALSVHAVTNEYDYFTAVDDHKKADVDEDAGAGMIGTVEFNSSTLYRYATLDVDRLQDNLGDAEMTRRATEAFLRAFVSSMPTGKQNTFANRTLPDAVLVVARDGQSISFVGAFEDAIKPEVGSGRVAEAIQRLAEHGRELHEAYGQVPIGGWVVGVGDKAAPLSALGTRGTLDAMVEAVGALVAARSEPAS